MAPTPRLLLWVLVLFLVDITSGDNVQPRTPALEAQSLNTIFRKWNISASNSKAKWNTSGDICWGLPMQTGQNFESEDRNPYIVCNCDYDEGKTCHITKLKVLQLNVKGTIPDELQNLAYLENIQIARNYLHGPLPAFIGNFTRMEYLSGGRNNFYGPVPKELGKLKALLSLGIDTCHFSGPLPPELGNLTRLQQMYILSMGVSSEIPSTFANLTKLQTWWAGDNSFGGKVPEFIGNMKDLQSLKFMGNSFQGPIPESFANLQKLTLLILSDVYGPSSSLKFIRDMQNLTTLILRNSRISDTLPDFSNYTTLELLDLSFNNLNGNLPSSLFNLKALTDLYLGNNSLSGKVPDEKSRKLINIDLSYNNLSGDLPPWQNEEGLNLSLAANYFDESSNGLSWELKCLQKDFPCFRNSPVYYSFGINCGGEAAESNGSFYEADNAELAQASYFVQGDYRWAVSSTGRFQNARSPQYTNETNSSNFINTIDPELYRTVRLSPSSLRYYGLALENGNYTVTMQFAETTFLDDQSYVSHGRRYFDIYIQGILVAKDFNIMQEAGNKSFTPVIRNYTTSVKSNFLEVHLFWAGKGSIAIPDWGYYGPSIAAISISPNCVPTVPNHLPAKSKAGLIAGVTVASAAIIGIIFGIYIWRTRRRNPDEEELNELRKVVDIFSYAELKKATKNFSPTNKLGSGGFGSVFKGKLSDGRIVAVKQLSRSTPHGKKQFIAEIGTICAVQHRNLVKLYGCCFEGVKRLVVYEFLQNGSLEDALYGKSHLQLDWPARYNICLNTARGLAYLHEESRLRIIHRDVKASNILLDADFNPKISDFGLAKLFDDSKTHVTTNVAGTVGYLAPEYALRGHLTEKVDIFAFGIVVLEILTGCPNSGAYATDGQKMFLLDWAWQLREKNCQLDMMDARLPYYNKEEADRMIGVALLCTQSDPMLRMPMSRVVAMLVGDMEISEDILKPTYLADWSYDGLSTAFTGTFAETHDLASSKFETSESSEVSPIATTVLLPRHNEDGVR